MQSACMVYDFLMWFPEWLRLPVAMLLLLAIMPLSGLLTFGNRRQAWAYTKEWGRGMLVVLAMAAIMGLILLPVLMAPPLP